MRTIRTTILGAAVVAAGLAVGAPAQAAPTAKSSTAAAAPAAVTAATTATSCQIRVYKPEMRRGHVAATSWAPGCRGTARVSIQLQRKRWWGWQKIASTTYSAPGPKTLYKGCKRGTTFTYRLMGHLMGGGNGYSPTMRAKCP
ncbi:hypothetical protein AB0L65_02895 [Nonomuraea sp. NPDC052116]|uniref:hypothetical protein n=1 Tax=Nonomuraea sp. NPDC052116 TaxID=3155665 RepID=UPI003448EBB8